MALWKEQVAPRKESAAIATEPSIRKDEKTPIDPTLAYDEPRRVAPRDGKESVIGADLTIEGKIDGAGHIRIAGRFKGDVNVEGNLTIDPGAKITGGVKANAVTHQFWGNKVTFNQLAQAKHA